MTAIALPRTTFPIYEHTVRRKLEDLIARVFSPPFRKIFSPVFDPGAAARYTLTLQPDNVDGSDTTVREDVPDTNYGTLVLLQSVGTAGSRRNSLIKFNLSSVPVGATIISANLTLTLSAIAPSSRTIRLYRILAVNSTWTELNATWNYAVDSTTRWAGDIDANGGVNAGCSVLGTDYSPTESGSISVVLNDPTGTIYNVNLNLAEFALMIQTNCGFVLTQTLGNTPNFASSDNSTESYHPKLVVVYDA